MSYLKVIINSGIFISVRRPYPPTKDDIFSPPRKRKNLLLTHPFWLYFCPFCINFTSWLQFSPLSFVFPPVSFTIYSFFYLPPLNIFPPIDIGCIPGGGVSIYSFQCKLYIPVFNLLLVKIACLLLKIKLRVFRPGKLGLDSIGKNQEVQIYNNDQIWFLKNAFQYKVHTYSCKHFFDIKGTCAWVFWISTGLV